MRVLVKINPFDRAEANDPNEVAAGAFSSVQSQYEDEASLDDSYLYEPDDPETFADELCLVDGLTDPERIKEIARGWNKRIQDEFDRCVTAIHHAPQDLDGTVMYLQAAPSTIYDMKKAAMALDNSFYDFAENLLLVVREGYFTTILKDEDLADIEAHPENYVKIDVSAK